MSTVPRFIAGARVVTGLVTGLVAVTPAVALAKAPEPAKPITVIVTNAMAHKLPIRWVHSLPSPSHHTSRALLTTLPSLLPSHLSRTLPTVLARTSPTPRH
jgi:hypothetical protein